MLPQKYLNIESITWKEENNYITWYNTRVIYWMCQHNTEASEKFLASVTLELEREKICQNIPGLRKTNHTSVAGLISGSEITSCSLKKQFSKCYTVLYHPV